MASGVGAMRGLPASSPRGGHPRPPSLQLGALGGGSGWCFCLVRPSYAPGSAKVWDGWYYPLVGIPPGPPPYFLPGPLTLGSTVLSLRSPHPAFCPSAPGSSARRDTSRRSVLERREQISLLPPQNPWIWIPYHQLALEGTLRHFSPRYFLGNNKINRIFP